MGTRYAGDDNDSYFDDLFLKIWQNESCLSLSGDLNQDDIINILDIVQTVNYVLNMLDFDDDQICSADMNADSIVNVLDIVTLVNFILSN